MNLLFEKPLKLDILGSFIGMPGLVLYTFGRAAFLDIPSIILAAASLFALLKMIDLLCILLSDAILSVLLFGLF